MRIISADSQNNLRNAIKPVHTRRANLLGSILEMVDGVETVQAGEAHSFRNPLQNAVRSRGAPDA